MVVAAIPVLSACDADKTAFEVSHSHPPTSSSAPVECDSQSVRIRVANAMQEIEHGVDPCGDSPAIRRIIESFRRCDPASYKICIDTLSPRNYVDPAARDHSPQPTSLIWNPDLRTELESACAGDASHPVLRDPTASLLHEIVHVVQDCNGLDPAANEVEAVRIENVYRRARGLCQRTRYGEHSLPADSFVPCGSHSCSCPPANESLPASHDGLQLTEAAAGAPEQAAGDTGRDARAPGDSPSRDR